MSEKQPLSPKIVSLLEDISKQALNYLVSDSDGGKIPRKPAKQALEKWLWSHLDEFLALNEHSLKAEKQDIIAHLANQKSARAAHKQVQVEETTSTAARLESEDYIVCTNDGTGIKPGPVFKTEEEAQAYIKTRPEDDLIYAIQYPDGHFEF